MSSYSGSREKERKIYQVWVCVRKKILWFCYVLKTLIKQMIYWIRAVFQVGCRCENLFMWVFSLFAYTFPFINITSKPDSFRQLHNISTVRLMIKSWLFLKQTLYTGHEVIKSEWLVLSKCITFVLILQEESISFFTAHFRFSTSAIYQSDTHSGYILYIIY